VAKLGEIAHLPIDRKLKSVIYFLRVEKPKTFKKKSIRNQEVVPMQDSSSKCMGCQVVTQGVSL
jgi:hypothetical protein